MTTKQKIALGLVAGATVVSGLYGVSQVSAADSTTNFPPMVQRMVEKFNLNTDEVLKMVEEDRTERRTERESELKVTLDQAVKDGKITEAQKTVILAKHEEIQAKIEALGTLTGSERRTKMTEIRTEMNEYLASQGIDESIMPGPRGPQGGEGQGTGFGGGMHRGNR